jgi:diguanylate cyclase (GGDEF)-like protein
MHPDSPSSVLIVDDNAKNLQVLAEILGNEHYKVALAKDGGKALNFVRKRCPDLILLDIMMPQLDGFEVCKLLKADRETRDIPVIFISALTETEDKLKGFRAGGVDYVTKPFQKEEVLARVKTHLELKRSQEELKSAYHKLQKAYEELEIAARTDSLTRLSNRRDMMEKIKYEKKKTDRSGDPFALILADIDNFKAFNDQYGHDCGDYVLIAVSDVIRGRVRKQDTAARWGGEEFLLLLPETELEGARTVAASIQDALAETAMTHDRRSLRVTLTYGISICRQGMDIDRCLKAADESLYRGKHEGKNRIVLSEDQPALPESNPGAMPEPPPSSNPGASSDSGGAG